MRYKTASKNLSPVTLIGVHVEMQLVTYCPLFWCEHVFALVRGLLERGTEETTYSQDKHPKTTSFIPTCTLLGSVDSGPLSRFFALVDLPSVCSPGEVVLSLNYSLRSRFYAYKVLWQAPLPFIPSLSTYAC